MSQAVILACLCQQRNEKKNVMGYGSEDQTYTTVF